MKAVVYKGPNKVAVEDVDDPEIEHPGDAIIRLTSSGICGSDLHMYEGRTVVKPGRVLGHEPLGVIEKVGDAVTSFKKGDRVVVTFNVACGHCMNCVRGFPSACLTVNPEMAGGAFGYAKMGPYKGAQAELLRVPFADFNCTKLPGSPGDQWEDDFLLLSDVFPTGFFATMLAMVMPGLPVAVFGAGPVGLLSAYSAILQGAGQVFVVDYIPDRLELARSIGAIPIDFTISDPVAQIEALRSQYSAVDTLLPGDKKIQEVVSDVQNLAGRAGVPIDITRSDPVAMIQLMRAMNPAIVQSLLPGEEKMKGVMSGIDAVGYQARDRNNPSKENPTQVISDLVRLVNPTGHLGIIGVFTADDPGGSDEHAKKGEYILPFGQLWEKGLTVGTGQTPVKKVILMLRDMIIAGAAKPGFIVSHRISIEDAPAAYKEFSQRADGYTKVIIEFEK
ncbi:alcohol dehydrogenase [Methanosarcina sp. MSH10X1]|uniref:glutathione-independent formaldehyde dehydrogenase n=1 Tax=Methanosarcina sp. MSH10X1 TaxID=2507075 RepID=UPI000FFBEFE1|nr:glutathione-independent formaldehyde dehydrogenase [Methanosarcina sp. MSH10X1]RXA17614.1 alcohol dehydrogenase [Methanosarcina sp. MSH10X1]